MHAVAHRISYLSHLRFHCREENRNSKVKNTNDWYGQFDLGNLVTLYSSQKRIS